MINASDPTLKTWCDVPEDSDFPIQNIPFGIFQKEGQTPRAASRIGDTVIDLAALANLGYFADSGIDDLTVFVDDTLNRMIALGRPVWRIVRSRIAEIFSESNATLRNNPDHRAAVLSDIRTVNILLPVHVGDYTDFYSSIEHATNVGTMFRDPENALLPNWKHLPVGYHGRSSSIVISGTSIHRPKGQVVTGDSTTPHYTPSRLLDFELEMAFIIGKETKLGNSVSTKEAHEHIFGLLLFNDLSARDIQKWEYVPLGPFLAKSFGSVVSPWIVTLDALEPFRVAGPIQDVKVLPYLECDENNNYDITLEVLLQPEGGDEYRICKSNFGHMYWNMNQQLAHQTVNGCNIRVGDLYASGTISGPTPDSYGSMLELCWKGTKPIHLPDGSERKFIKDQDTIIMRGYAIKDGIRIGFGEVRTTILPAT